MQDLPHTRGSDLSKSKLISYRQCPKRLWLEVKQPHLRVDSPGSEAIFRAGHAVGELAQRLYDPENSGHLIDFHKEGVSGAIGRTTELLNGNRIIFEGGFSAAGARCFADIVQPIPNQPNSWGLVEVKASTSVKPYQRDDAAIQAYIARRSGANIESVSIAHINSSWIYTGDGDYRGFLVEEDLTYEVLQRESEVEQWIASAHQVACAPTPPQIKMGRQCTEPFDCGFADTCRKEHHPAEFPVTWLPRIQLKALKALIETNAVADMRDVPAGMLNELQERVRHCTLTGEVYFDLPGARSDLSGYPLPLFFLDFETINFAIPPWAGTRPFQMIPFQFSLHCLDGKGELSHVEFLDLTGDDPSQPFCENLVAACGTSEPIVVYNASFEGARLNELAVRFPVFASALLSIKQRLVDLRPIAERRFYHPDQHGSWSIKKLLPAVVPQLMYESLKGVADGGGAMEAYAEGVAVVTSTERKEELSRQLLAYCALDTVAMVEIWKAFSGQSNHV